MPALAGREKEVIWYVTKYALTDGVFAVEGTIWKEKYLTTKSYSPFVIGRDAFESVDDAIADAEKKRTKKIASLKKQIAALEKLVIAAPSATAA